MSNESITKENAFTPIEHTKLREIAPSIFTEDKASRTSQIYAKTSTIQIVQDLEKLGWFPTRAEQRRTKVLSAQGYQKHTIWFRNPDVMLLTENKEVEAYPEICLINSHDGLTAFQLSLGLFRVACSNGLAFQSDNFANFRIIHKGYNFTELEKIVQTITERAPSMIEVIEQMKALILPDDVILNYIDEAVIIREKYSQGVQIDVIVSDFLVPRREEDQGKSLWKLYNLTQEKLLKGGFLNTENNRMTKMITYLDKILWVNKDLFELTERYFNQFKSLAPVIVEGNEQYDQWQKIKNMVRMGATVPTICEELNISKKKYYASLTNLQREELEDIRSCLK